MIMPDFPSLDTDLSTIFHGYTDDPSASDFGQAFNGDAASSILDHHPPGDFPNLTSADTNLYEPIDTSLYEVLNPDVGSWGGNLLQHILDFGAKEGRAIPIYGHGGELGLFSEQAYLGRRPDVANAVNDGIFTSGLEHYLKFGINEETGDFKLSDPVFKPGFDAEFYLATYPDVAKAVMNGTISALDHYERFGQNEGRFGSEEAYFSANKQLPSGSKNPPFRTSVQPADFLLDRTRYDLMIPDGKKQEVNGNVTFKPGAVPIQERLRLVPPPNLRDDEFPPNSRPPTESNKRDRLIVQALAWGYTLVPMTKLAGSFLNHYIMGNGQTYIAPLSAVTVGRGENGFGPDDREKYEQALFKAAADYFKQHPGEKEVTVQGPWLATVAAENKQGAYYAVNRYYVSGAGKFTLEDGKIKGNLVFGGLDWYNFRSDGQDIPAPGGSISQARVQDLATTGEAHPYSVVLSEAPYDREMPN